MEKNLETESAVRAVASAEEKLSQLNTLLSEMQEYCRTSRLIPDAHIENLERLLQEYSEQAQKIRQYCAAWELSEDIALEEMAALLQNILHREAETEKWIRETQPFCALICQAERVQRELEQAKDELRALLEQREQEPEQMKQALLPFWAVVQNVLGADSALDAEPEAMDAMEEKFTPEFYRAVYRGKMQLASGDTCRHTDAGEGEPAAEDSGRDAISPTENLGADPDIAGHASDIEPEPQSEAEPEQDAEPREEGTLPPQHAESHTAPSKETVLFYRYQDYVRDGTHLIIQDPKTGTAFQSKRFLNDVVRQPEAIQNMMLMGHAALEKFVPDPAREGYRERMEYLYHKGYLARAVISTDNPAEEPVLKGWCLTERGTASFFRTESVKEYERIGIRCKALYPIPLKQLSTTLIERLIQVNRALVYCRQKDNTLIICRVWNAEQELPGITITLETGPKCNLFSALLERGNEQTYLDTLKSCMQSVQEEQQFVITVKDAGDVSVLTTALGLEAELAARVWYCCGEGDSSRWWDGNGAEGVPDFAECPEQLETDGEEEGMEDAPEPETDAAEPEAENDDEAVASDAPEQPEPAENPELPDAGTEPPQGEDTDNESSEEAQCQEFWTQCCQMFEKGAFPYALTLARALANRRGGPESLYRQLAYAIDDPALDKSYKYTEIQQVFPESYGVKFSYDALGLAAYLRMFFSFDARLEPHYVSNCHTVLDQNLLYSQTTRLKDLLFILSKAFQQAGRGFDSGMLDAMLDFNFHQQKLDGYAAKAAALLNSRLEETKVDSKRVKETRQVLFGSESMFHKILTNIRDKNTSEAQDILDKLKPFLAGGELPVGECTASSLSTTAMEDYANDVWGAQASVRYRTDKLKGAAKNNILNRMTEIITVAVSWAVLTREGRGISDTDQKNVLSGFRPRLQALLQEAGEELGRLSAEPGTLDSAALAILRTTLQDLLERLYKGYDPAGRQYFYLDFLYGNRVELDEHYIPCLETDFSEIASFGLCRRIVKASRDPKLGWDKVLRRIFEPDDLSQGCDYGSALLIQRYLEDPASGGGFEWPDRYNVEQNILAARSSIAARESDFLARLEMADNYEWLEDSGQMDEISADMERRKAHYEEDCNFGFYFRTMDAYLKHLQRRAEIRRPIYQQRLDDLRSRIGEKWPIFQDIEEMIQRQMYAVAQDYMDRVEKENCREVPENSMLTADSTELSRFLNRYSTLLTGARDATSIKLSDIFARSHRGEGISLIRSGQELLESWPRSSSSPESMSSKLQKLFTGLGLEVDGVKYRSENHFLLHFKKPALQLDYPHPIGAFGTEMFKNGLNVFLLFGNKDAVTMNTEIRRIMNAAVAGSSVLLADTPMSLSDRRKLAQKIKTENQNLTPYLILDRVLILHLAGEKQVERWNVFLKCALPFHYCNPYTENSTMSICPEMFIGRRTELEQVINPAGANIIYGGRQLGKTALLRRACVLVDNRASCQWSIYLDIKREDADSAAVFIYRKLQDEKLLPPDDAPILWPDLVRKIANAMRERKITQFLLLLDEADKFLHSAAAGGYQPIDYLVQLQAETENRFKFVLAGLHNVMKFHEQSMSSNLNLPKLGAVTIKPLHFREASELLERPLSYLGFCLRKENTHLIAQILSSTNYYPGLIQFYASRLVRSIGQGAINVEQEPPYELKDAQILTLLKDPEFQNNIREKFMITLGIDEDEKGYYRTLAYVLARCCFVDPEQAGDGYSAQMLYENCREFDIYSIADLSLDQVEVLLNELIDLNVLRKKERGGENLYMFNRISFRHLLGDKEQVEDVLADIMVKEERR